MQPFQPVNNFFFPTNENNTHCLQLAHLAHQQVHHLLQHLHLCSVQNIKSPAIAKCELCNSRWFLRFSQRVRILGTERAAHLVGSQIRPSLSSVDWAAVSYCLIGRAGKRDCLLIVFSLWSCFRDGSQRSRVRHWQSGPSEEETEGILFMREALGLVGGRWAACGPGWCHFPCGPDLSAHIMRACQCQQGRGNAPRLV